MQMEAIGRYIMLAGAVLFIVGGVIFLAARLGIPLGRLLGDIHAEGEGWSFSFPIATSIIASIVLTIILNLIGRFLNK